MIWNDLEEGDVLLSSYEGDQSSYLLLAIGPSINSPHPHEVKITMACLLSARVSTHDRRGMANLSPTYTVLRGANLVQQGGRRVCLRRTTSTDSPRQPRVRQANLAPPEQDRRPQGRKETRAKRG